VNTNSFISPYCQHSFERFHQGDILRDIKVVVSGKIEGILEYALILTQECDLQQDFKNREQREKNKANDDDKFIRSILIVPAYRAELFRDGLHLFDSEIQPLKMQTFNNKTWPPVKKNHIYRYHFLESFTQLQVPELMVDFKHYFTISRDVLYEKYMNPEHCIASLRALFRENLSIRFAQYLARIGLPEPEPEPEPISPHQVTN
jgi:hypothetical protein